MYSLLVIVAIAVAIIWFKRWQGLSPEKQKKTGKKMLIWIAVAVILGLVVAGRAHWLMGVLAALMALAGRVAQFAQYIPLFKKLFGEGQNQQPSDDQAVAGNVDMSKKDAADILGVDVNANEAEVREAHKKLMQKIHPDRGGTDALAKQINQAKETLLKS